MNYPRVGRRFFYALAALLCLFILTGALPVMAGEAPWYADNNDLLREKGRQWLEENPEIKDASPQERAEYMTRRYMEALQEDGAPLDSSLGDSVVRTITGTRGQIVNCSTHYTNLSELFRTANIEEGRIGQLETRKTGLRGWNLLDVNRNHGTITVLGDDNIYRTYDVWMHAEERNRHNDRERRSGKTEVRGSFPFYTVHPILDLIELYGDAENSKYPGMPVEDWNNQMQQEGYGVYIYTPHVHFPLDKDFAENDVGIDPSLLQGTEIVCNNAVNAIDYRNQYDYDREYHQRRELPIKRGRDDPGSDLITPLTTDPVYRIAIAGERRIVSPEGRYRYSASVSPSGGFYYEWSFDGRSSGPLGRPAVSLGFDQYTENATPTLSVTVRNNEGDVLGTAAVMISLVLDEDDMTTVTIAGERFYTVNLEPDQDHYDHRFFAQASPEGSYIYDWNFGDGRTGRGQDRDGGTYRYQNITSEVTYEPRVTLYDLDGTYLAEDSIIIRFVMEDEESDDVEDRQDYMDICGQWKESGSGGAGTTRTVYDISELPQGASFDMRFDARNIPDRFIVEYEGNVVYNSGWRGSQQRVEERPNLYPGGLSGSGRGNAAAIFEKNIQDSFTVTVEGHEPNTIWSYALLANCPPTPEP